MQRWTIGTAAVEESTPFIALFQKNTSCRVYHKKTHNNKQQQNPYKNWSDRKNETNRIKISDCYFPPPPPPKLGNLYWSINREEQNFSSNSFEVWSGKLNTFEGKLRASGFSNCQQNPTQPRGEITQFKYKTYQINHLLHVCGVHQKAGNQTTSSSSPVDANQGPSTQRARDRSCCKPHALGEQRGILVWLFFPPTGKPTKNTL